MASFSLVNTFVGLSGLFSPMKKLPIVADSGEATRSAVARCIDAVRFPA